MGRPRAARPTAAMRGRPQAVPAALIQAREALQAPLDLLLAEGVGAYALVTLGSPAAEIARVARLRRCDLVVMSTHGRGTVGRGVMGGMTYAVTRMSRVPALAVVPSAAERSRAEG
jgi:nucleotide-binding universal stress UspA family protein